MVMFDVVFSSAVVLDCIMLKCLKFSFSFTHTILKTPLNRM